MNSNELSLATNMLNDLITAGDRVALAALADLVEETRPEAVGLVRELAAAVGEGQGLYWNDEVLYLVRAVLEALGAGEAAREAAVREIYDTAIEVS